jgi:hypothetical protein
MRTLILLCVLGCGGQIMSNNDAGDATTDVAPGCTNLDPSAFGVSCSSDPDCVSVVAGQLCAGYTCSCPTGSIAKATQAAYEAVVSKVPQGSGHPCLCPFLGASRCIASACVFCPNPELQPASFPPGCPDAGL